MRCAQARLLAAIGIRANMTLSIPPDIHNLSQRRQKMTEPGPRVTRTKNLVKVGLVVQEICSQTDRQTDTLITIVRHRNKGAE